ncbi:MAG: hypothetical protein U1F65_03000 [Verrucomicrobiota bacterium]
METQQASEHLQVIRTLMERSALYRRALAPIMVFCGAVGIVAGLVGSWLTFKTDGGFILFWSGTAVLALTGAFLLVRKQAFKDSEPLWSSPTRRVAQALLPPLLIGAFINLVGGFKLRGNDPEVQILFITVWSWLYGCALHSAGFFMVRGIRLFSWIFLISGCALFIPTLTDRIPALPCWMMGVLFGVSHLAYGVYLYFTENRKPAL